jgi:hypothetical protein
VLRSVSNFLIRSQGCARAADDLMNAVLFPIETEDASAFMQLFHL